MRPLLLLSLVAVLISLSSCGKPEYWVKGLTLPPGSTVSSKSETTKMEGMPSTFPMMGELDKMLLVQFECKGGWPAVSSHIDACMKKEGYVDTMSGLAAMSASMPGAAKGALDSMKMYTKNGEKYAVMVNNMGGMMAAYAKDSKVKIPEVPGMAGFTMSVMKFK
jgi:hypothetical protein